MDHSVIRTKLHEYLRTTLARAKAYREQHGPLSPDNRTRIEDTLSLLTEGNREYWDLLGAEYAQEELNKFFEKTGLRREDCREQTAVILDEIRKGQIGYWKALLAHSETLEVYDFTEPQSSALSANSSPSAILPANNENAASAGPSGPLLSELFTQRRAEAERANEWSPKALDDYQKWTNLFIELQGDRPIVEYKKSDVREFKTLLQSMPSNLRKYPETRGLPAREAIDAAIAKGRPILSNSTVNKALSRLQATWTWAAKQLDEDVVDIFGPMKLPNKGSARNEADPFSKTQLQTIFKSPIFTGCKSTRFRTEHGPTDMSATDWYWLPLLGLWTGARLNELCQIRTADIDEEDGIPFLHIREGKETQRVKGHKKRIVPLHPELIRLGFVRFVQAQRSAGHDRVFPALELGTKGYYSDKPSKDFTRHLRVRTH
ncbi:MAG: site-specific integrase [Thioclava sp.]|nr:site-specific integrase [Thioclava sp.]MBD3804717.1 site-specific integrase [Thioclava sp.]